MTTAFSSVSTGFPSPPLPSPIMYTLVYSRKSPTGYSGAPTVRWEKTTPASRSARITATSASCLTRLKISESECGTQKTISYTNALRKNAPRFSQLFLCLSRACLGTTISLSPKNGSKKAFSAPRAVDSDKAGIPAGRTKSGGVQRFLPWNMFSLFVPSLSWQMICPHM